LGSDFLSQALAEGVTLHIHPTEKFKTTTVYLHIQQPLSPETVTYGALLPMVLARGSAEHPTTAALAAQFDDLYGAHFGCDVGRRGEVQLLSFRLEVVGDRFVPEGSLFGEALRTLAGVLLRPAQEDGGFVARYVEQEKANLRRRIEGLINDKQGYAFYRCAQEMCRGEPFELHRLGRIADLDGITPGSLAAYHEQMLRSAPVDLFVVGAVDPERTASAVAEAFAALPPESRPATGTLVKAAPERAPRTVQETMDVNQGVLVIGFRTGTTVRDEGYVPLLVANGLLGAFGHSKLFQNVREKHGIAYYAYSMLETVKGIGYMYAGIDFGQFQNAVAICTEQLRALQEGGIGEEELETTKRALTGETLSALDSPGDLVDLALDRVFSGRELSVQDRCEAVAGVTREQVTEAARRIAVDTVYFLTGKEER
jgi:predicted Zn-dependent peptidase